LNKNFEKLEDLLLEPGKIPDLIAISETKLQTKFNSYLLRYSFVQYDSNTNAGGVGLFIKDTLNFAIVENYQLNCNGYEQIWVKIKLNNTEKVFFCNIQASE